MTICALYHAMYDLLLNEKWPKVKGNDNRDDGRQFRYICLCARATLATCHPCMSSRMSEQESERMSKQISEQASERTSKCAKAVRISFIICVARTDIIGASIES